MPPASTTSVARWPKGFVCSHWGRAMAGGLATVGSCVRLRSPHSVTAGTIFGPERTPLSGLVPPALFATAKDGTSALGLQRTLEIGSYQTAWAMLHRLRIGLVAPGRDRLMGTVEDETYIGGEEAGLRVAAKGRSPCGVAVELKQRGFGAVGWQSSADGSAASLPPRDRTCRAGGHGHHDAWQATADH